MVNPPRARCRRLVAGVIGCMALAASADGEPPVPPSAADYEYLRPGFKALEVLEDLKVLHGRRGADCMSAIGHERFCSCLNDSLTLELSFTEYVVLITDVDGDASTVSLPPAKRRHRDEAVHLRDVCVAKAFQGRSAGP
ncbi:MAG: hypothetical protein R3F45_00840 [Gammaproteobacteria bacterium]